MSRRLRVLVSGVVSWPPRLPENIQRRQMVAALLAVAGVLYLVFAGGTTDALVVLATIAAAAGTFWDPRKDRPRPTLTLRVDGAEREEPVLLGVRRPLDLDLLVEDAVRTAAAASTRSTAAVAITGRLPATARQRERFQSEVEEYGGAIRSWLEDVDAWRRGRAALLDAEVIQRNRSTVDAQGAGVYVLCPDSFEPLEGFSLDPPEEPQAPAPPAPRSVLEGLDGSALLDRPIMAPSLLFDERPALTLSLWDPDYDRYQGGLRISWMRQPVRHGEEERTGEPFRVLVPAGTHTLSWEVHAANMAKARSGEWHMVCRDTTEGEPIVTMAQLRADLGREGDDE